MTNNLGGASMAKRHSKLARFGFRWVRLLLNVKGLRSLTVLPRYLYDWNRFRKSSRFAVRWLDTAPMLEDAAATTPMDAHYFFQAAWLARHLASEPPVRHYDIGSSIYMISVLSAFVDLVFIDYRPIDTNLPGLLSKAGDLTCLQIEDAPVASLSCLHVLEHVGLGRYGDPICIDGPFLAAQQLSKSLALGGQLYLSVPVGRERICFNAHYVFDPETVIGMFPDFELLDFALVDDSGRFMPAAGLQDARRLSYGCGMFHFRKLN